MSSSPSAPRQAPASPRRVLGIPVWLAGLLMAVVLLAAGVAAGCSGGDDDSGGDDPPAATSDVREDEEQPEEEPEEEPELPREAEGDSSPGLDIPDDDEDGVSDTIELEETEGEIEAIDVQVEIAHPFVGDLVVTLEGPSGAEATLQENEGGSDDDLSLRLDESDPELRPLLAESAGGDWELTVVDTSSSDEGTLEEWSVSVETDPDAEVPEPIANEASGTSPGQIDIPDNVEAGRASFIDLDEVEGEITEMDVAVEITHPFVGDLQVVLLGPSGAAGALWDREGGPADDLSLAFDESSPELQPFLGEPAEGEWRLVVQDRSAGDVGTLDEWTLSVTTE